MTPRQARRKLGSRVSRRAGTKTRCIPGASNGHSGTKQGPTPKYKNHHAGVVSPVSVRVRALRRKAAEALHG